MMIPLRKAVASAMLSATLLCVEHATPQTHAVAAAKPIEWHTWSNEIFAQAAREHKFVLLDLEAVWCHWCHVMDQQTYSNPSVRRLMAEKYLAVKVDQDSRPDISNRYEDFGWPATVIFNAKGGEIVKRQGYLPPVQMASILQAVIDDPSPGPSVVPETKLTYATTPFLAASLLADVRREFDKQYDPESFGWAFGHKYLDADSVAFASMLAGKGDALQQQRAQDTLKATQKLLDPVWGGSYQYSTGGVWNEPHFEKLLSIQAQSLRTYAQAYGQWHKPEYLAAAQNIHGYVRNFLTSPDGAFYVSQDADVVRGKHSDSYFALNDAKRRALGIPRVDRHLYARENGWMIVALCALYGSTGDVSTLHEAERSATWVLAHRTLPGGGYDHGDEDLAGPYLADTLAMGQAFLSLYEATSNVTWLKHAEAAQQFISTNFASANGAGYVTSRNGTDAAYQPHPERDENAQAARFGNLLFQYTGTSKDRDAATRAMRYLATREVAMQWLSAPVLLAEREYTHEPLHMTIVGSKKDPAAAKLFSVALSSGPVYKRVEWWDPGAGQLPRADVQYPRLPHAAAFLCTASSCSSPITSQDVLATRATQSAR